MSCLHRPYPTAQPFIPHRRIVLVVLAAVPFTQVQPHLPARANCLALVASVQAWGGVVCPQVVFRKVVVGRLVSLVITAIPSHPARVVCRVLQSG